MPTATVGPLGCDGGSSRFARCCRSPLRRTTKWKLIYPSGPWNGLTAVEFATLEYVDWFNTRRLHGQITGGPGYTTPADFETDYYRSQSIPTDPAGPLRAGSCPRRRRPRPHREPRRPPTFNTAFRGLLSRLETTSKNATDRQRRRHDRSCHRPAGPPARPRLRPLPGRLPPRHHPRNRTRQRQERIVTGPHPIGAATALRAQPGRGHNSWAWDPSTRSTRIDSHVRATGQPSSRSSGSIRPSACRSDGSWVASCSHIRS